MSGSQRLTPAQESPCQSGRSTSSRQATQAAPGTPRRAGVDNETVAAALNLCSLKANDAEKDPEVIAAARILCSMQKADSKPHPDCIAAAHILGDLEEGTVDNDHEIVAAAGIIFSMMTNDAEHDPEVVSAARTLCAFQADSFFSDAHDAMSDETDATEELQSQNSSE